MTSIDYSIFSKESLELNDVSASTYDFFVSAYNSSERVRAVFTEAKAINKAWLIHEEYAYESSDLPSSGKLFINNEADSPVDFWLEFFEWIGLPRQQGATTIAVDITGMMRPHLMLLPLMLRNWGFERLTVFYSDPNSYASGHGTRFTKGPVEGISVIPGMEGMHRSSAESRDSIIVGGGYDHTLIQAVAESKRSADHYLLLGLPSLQPHMYQESLLRVSRVRESIRDYRSRTLLFAPASDPFTTAQVLSDQVRRIRRDNPGSNVYLSPVGAKTQVLGFAWYFLCEARSTATSMLFPFNRQYERETSIGISCVHRYELELDMIMSS